ncbi:MAG: PQQ-binding-like beta-propeller repeat protein [Chloroflexi bacterium]|nr:PQQ-binding-like beta-propeller repeat protein [Chloroflexota bacterium]
MKPPRLIGAALLLVLAAAVLSACGGVVNPQGWAAPTFDSDSLYYYPGKERLVAVPLLSDPLAQAWQFPNSAFANQKDLNPEATYGEPVRDGDRLYVAAYDEGVFALNPADGSIAWGPKELKGHVLDGTTLAGGRLFVGTDEGYLYAFDPATGNPAAGWQEPKKLGSGIWASPVGVGDTVVVATMGGKVRALAMADGATRWEFKVEGAIASLTALGENRLFVPTLSKKVIILDATSGVVVSGPFQATDWVWNTPAFKDGIAYFGDLSGDVYALDITSGQAKWTYSAGHKVKSGPAIVGDVLVIADREPVVHFLKLGDGTLQNTVPLADVGTIRANVVAGPAGTRFEGKAIIATTKGRLFQATPNGQVVEIPIAAVPK